MAENSEDAPDGERCGGPNTEWEVFVRETETEPLRHAGSVTADDAPGARERASSLFDWCAVDLWLCPTAAVERSSTRGLETRVAGDESTSEETTAATGGAAGETERVSES